MPVAIVVGHSGAQTGELKLAVAIVVDNGHDALQL